jgi:restriction endonuclease Mrr
MEEVVDGTRRGIVVECKHTGAVGRPVVRKLHSAIATHGFDGPRRGMVVTTARFTGPAEEYAARLDESVRPWGRHYRRNTGARPDRGEGGAARGPPRGVGLGGVLPSSGVRPLPKRLFLTGVMGETT